MYIYMYTYIYTYIYYIFICIYVCVCVHLRLYVQPFSKFPYTADGVPVYVSVFVIARTYICFAVRKCLFVRMHVCVCVFLRKLCGRS